MSLRAVLGKKISCVLLAYCLISLAVPVVGLAQTSLYTEILGANSNDKFANALSCVGNQAAVGVPGDVIGSATGAGSVSVYDMGSSTLIAQIVRPGSPLGGEQFGRSLTYVPDISGDSIADLLVGSPSNGSTTPATAYLYTNVTTVPLVTMNQIQTFERFGTAVAVVGDITGDSRVEVAVSAPFRSVGFTNAGAIDVFDVASSLGNATRIRTYSGGSPNEQLGAAIAELGDLDADTFHDFAASAPLGTTVGGQTGLVRIFSTGSGATNLLTIDGTEIGEEFGASIANVGDVNSDGFEDLLIGAPRSTIRGADSGRAVLVSGISLTQTAASVQILCVIPSIAAGDLFGTAVAHLGDVNSDGLLDFGISSPGSANGSGSMDIYSYSAGKCNLQTTASPVTSGGPVIGESFGIAISGRNCDFNTDGISDYVVGAKGGSDDDGHAFFLLGAAAPTPVPTPAVPPQSSFDFRIDTKGRLTLNLNYTGLPSGVNCTAELFGRWKIGNTLGPVTKLASGDLFASNIQVVAAPLPRVDKAINTIPVVNMVVRTTCPNSVSLSNVFARYMNCGSTEPAVLPQEWLKLLKSGFTAAGGFPPPPAGQVLQNKKFKIKIKVPKKKRHHT